MTTWPTAFDTIPPGEVDTTMRVGWHLPAHDQIRTAIPATQRSIGLQPTRTLTVAHNANTTAITRIDAIYALLRLVDRVVLPDLGTFEEEFEELSQRVALLEATPVPRPAWLDVNPDPPWTLPAWDDYRVTWDDPRWSWSGSSTQSPVAVFGDLVVIHGLNFTVATRVDIGAAVVRRADFEVHDDHVIAIRVPSDAADLGEEVAVVQVAVVSLGGIGPGLELSLELPPEPVPELTSAQPESGLPNSYTDLTGTDLPRVTTVVFTQGDDTTTTPVDSVSDTLVRAKLPPATWPVRGDIDIHVVTAGGMASNPVPFFMEGVHTDVDLVADQVNWSSRSLQVRVSASDGRSFQGAILEAEWGEGGQTTRHTQSGDFAWVWVGPQSITNEGGIELVVTISDTTAAMNAVQAVTTVPERAPVLSGVQPTSALPDTDINLMGTDLIPVVSAVFTREGSGDATSPVERVSDYLVARLPPITWPARGDIGIHLMTAGGLASNILPFFLEGEIEVVLGDNILTAVDSSFEVESPFNWDPWAGGRGTIARSVEQALDGNWSLRIRHTGTPGLIGALLATAARQPVVSGRRYRLTLPIFTLGPGRPCVPQIAWHNAAGSAVNPSATAPGQSVTGEWTDLIVEGVAPDTATTARCAISLSDTQEGEDHYIDFIRIQPLL